MRRSRQLAALSTTSSIVLLRTDRQTARALLLFFHSIYDTRRFDASVHRDLVRATTGVGIPRAVGLLIAE